jgi:2-keto-3-deoxy-6-phosphogluconate aldolase
MIDLPFTFTLSMPQVIPSRAVGAGSEPCPPQLAKDGKFDEISKRAAEFVQVVNAARVK